MKKILTLILSLYALSSSAQQKLSDWDVAQPLEVTTLSGSYCELRRNHFHGGLDFRTGGVENKPIYAIDKGYVSRISISARGYGKLVYITHPNGYTSLYAHLNGFVPALDSIVKAKQYAQKSYEVEFTLAPDEYPVKKGEMFARSGNTGSSGGPHLHFELRKTDSNILQNPFMLNKIFKLQDNKKPKISSIKIYGLEGGKVNNLSNKRLNAVVQKGKGKVLQGGANIKAWGHIGFGIKSSDHMSGTSFTHNPREYKLYADGELISHIYLDNVKFEYTRSLNSMIDYKQHLTSGEFFIRSFKEKNNNLAIYMSCKGDGTININQERDYKMKYVVIDDFGNLDSLSFTIKGTRCELTPPTTNTQGLIKAGEPYTFDRKEFIFQMPKTTLFSDLDPKYSATASSKYYSKIYNFGDREIPINNYCDISIKVENDADVRNKNKLFIAKLTDGGLFQSAVGGKYANGYITGKTNTLGKFAIFTDNKRPIITAVHTKGLTRYPVLVFKIADGLSGIARYDGYIDGEWICFEHDAKTHTIRYQMDAKRIEKHKMHKFKLVVTDNCGNSTTYQRNIYW